MPTHTHYEQVLLGKFQEIKALQDEKKKSEAASRAAGARRPVARQGGVPGGPRTAPLAAARPGPTKAADVGPPGESPHQRAIRLLKAKQAKKGSAVPPAVATASGLRRPGVAGAGGPASQKPGSKGPNMTAAGQKATGGDAAPALKRPSMKRPSVKRPAPSPAPQITPTAADDAAQPPPAKFQRQNSWTRSTEGTTLFVGDLPPETNHMHLREWFESLGNVVHTRAITNFGFVTFEDPETAENALNAAKNNPIVVDGYHLSVNWSKGSGGGDRNRRPPPVERGGRDGGRGGGYSARQFHGRAPEEPPQVDGQVAAGGRGRDQGDDAGADDINRAAIVYDDL